MKAYDNALAALAKTLDATLPAGVQPEDQLKPPTKAVLEALAAHVEAFTEAKPEVGRITSGVGGDEQAGLS